MVQDKMIVVFYLVLLAGSSYICPAGEIIGGALAVGVSTVARTYSITLLSILGSLGSQYVPLFAMTSSPLRLEIQLVDAANKVLNSDQIMSSFSVSNVEYIASFLELSDNSMETINNSLLWQPLQYVIPSFRNYVYTQYLPAGGAQLNIPIAAKFSSLKSLFGIFRDTAKVNVVHFSLMHLVILDYGHII